MFRMAHLFEIDSSLKANHDSQINFVQILDNLGSFVKEFL